MKNREWQPAKEEYRECGAELEDRDNKEEREESQINKENTLNKNMITYTKEDINQKEPKEDKTYIISEKASNRS